MHPEVEKLLKLQETDLQVQHYNSRIELLPKQLAALEAKLSGTLQSLEANKQQIAQAASDKKKLEGNILDLEQKNSKYRGQLTDVKTNEQYKALLHEIEFNEKVKHAQAVVSEYSRACFRIEQQAILKKKAEDEAKAKEEEASKPQQQSSWWNLFKRGGG